MPRAFPPLLLSNALLASPQSGSLKEGGVLIENGHIRDCGSHLQRLDAHSDWTIIDCQGVIVAPGLIDMSVHTGEPGMEHRETLKTASEAAAAGGVTTIVTTPDTDPIVDTPAIVDFIIRRARDTAIVNVYPAAALTRGLLGEDMAEIGLLKEAGAVFFTDPAHSVMNAATMLRLMSYASSFDALVVHHLRDASLADKGVVSESPFSIALGLPGIPSLAETLILERDLRLLTQSGGRYHAHTVTCADSVEALKNARQRGLRFTAGASINHLRLTHQDIEDYRTFFKTDPPLRSETDRLSVVDALAEGVIDVVVSSHNPQGVESKRRPFLECSDGAVGLETLLSASLQLVHEGKISLIRLLRALSTRPAEILGLPGGRLEAGAPADLVVFDMNLCWTVEASALKSLCQNTPFDQSEMRGRVLATLVNGKIVYVCPDVETSFSLLESQR